MMTTRRIGRRFFLLGTGGAALTIPFLPSLLPSTAKARVGPPKRFIAMTTEHGGVYAENFWPSASLATEASTVLGDHTIHHGAIELRRDGSENVMSNVLRGDAGRLTPALAAKMNLLRGLDVPWACGHGYHMLGNYGRLAIVEDAPGYPDDQPSIDQLMAYSSCVYESTPRRRSLHLGHVGLSTTWANPETRSGGYEFVPSASSTQALFDSIYVPETVDPGPAPRTPIVDRVLESYRRLRDGAHGPGARLGRADRDRLEDYMARLSAIQSSMTATVAASCNDVSSPARFWDGIDGGESGRVEDYGPGLYQTYNDILIAAFMCDSSRVATLRCVDSFFNGPAGTDWHDTAHAAPWNAEEEAWLATGARNFFQYAFLDLISKMDDVADAEGGSLLDNSLVFWTQESGPETHTNDSQPVVMAGGATGALRTGLYVDYRNRDRAFVERAMMTERNPGLHYYQWLTACLDAMDVPRSEWPRAEGPLCGWPTDAGYTEAAHPYRDRIRDFSTNPLPVISV